MNYEETLKLIEAGFTADEIREMAKEKPEDVPGTPGTNPEEPNTKSGAEVKQPEVKQPEVSAEITNLTEQISKLNETVVKLQEANIKNASTGTAKVGNPVDEKIQEFIKGL